jgi:hypothetical protein
MLVYRYLPTVADAKAYALEVLGKREYACLDSIIRGESRWNPLAWNRRSGAYGLPQSKPGSKMASAGADWQTNPVTQIKWAISYGRARYGSLCAAAAFRSGYWDRYGGWHKGAGWW